jgi:glycosyltransferase involved in cell wall biosynthesis
MKILHINASDKIGGAAIAAFRLHNAMLSSGIESKYLVLTRTINDRADILTVSYFSQFVTKIVIKIIEKITTYSMHAKSGLFSSFKYGINLSHYSEIDSADVIYIHWISTFINYQMLKQLLKTGKTIFWYMHDMFAITGGCHHSFDCVKYQIKCIKCQYHKNNFPSDLSVWQYRKKEKIYKRFNNLIFITPSKWLFDCAKKSRLTQHKQIYHIPNSVDNLLFKPINRDIAKQVFLLSSKTKVIGFGADHVLVNPYKGWSYLRDALLILSKDKTLQNVTIEVLIFGSSYSKEIKNAIPFHTYFLGHLYDEYSLVMAYSCMDVFVIPSLAENFPNTILESICCNTPVVGFDIGGIPDMVNINTGYLAEYKNSDDLAKGISLILKTGRNNVLDNVKSFTPEEVLNKHKKMWDIENIQS